MLAQRQAHVAETRSGSVAGCWSGRTRVGIAGGDLGAGGKRERPVDGGAADHSKLQILRLGEECMCVPGMCGPYITGDTALL